jgi:hypothetical protein
MLPTIRKGKFPLTRHCNMPSYRLAKEKMVTGVTPSSIEVRVTSRKQKNTNSPASV